MRSLAQLENPDMLQCIRAYIRLFEIYETHSLPSRPLVFTSRRLLIKLLDSGWWRLEHRLKFGLHL
jgi:hypothetical protein